MAREPLVDVDLGSNGGHVRLYTAEEANEFVAVERQFWDSVAPEDRDHPWNFVSEALANVERARDVALSGQQGWGQFGHVLQDEYQKNRRLVHSKTPSGQLLSEIANEYGGKALRGALIFALNNERVDARILFQQGPDVLRGAMAYQLGISGVSRTSAQAAARSLDGFLERRERHWAKDREDVDILIADWERELAELENDHRDRIAVHERERQDHLGRFAIQSANEITNIKATEALFREHMRLKAPSEYWESKRKEHEGRAKTLRNWVFGTVGIGLLVYAAVLALQFENLRGLITSFKDNTPGLLVVVGLIVFAASIPLWFLRILVRFYLSESHLAGDARERQVMTLTYLALTESGSVTEADRAIILGALFRNSQDGIVKDNSGPDTSVAGLVARLLDTRP